MSIADVDFDYNFKLQSRDVGTEALAGFIKNCPEPKRAHFDWRDLTGATLQTLMEELRQGMPSA